MKQILFFIFIIGITSKGFGQSEFSKKFKTIPPLDIKLNTKKDSVPASDFPKITTPNILENPIILTSKLKPNNSFQMGVTNNFSMLPKNKFVNPGDKIVEKLNTYNVSSEPIRVDETTHKRFTFISDPDNLPIEFYEK